MFRVYMGIVHKPLYFTLISVAREQTSLMCLFKNEEFQDGQRIGQMEKTKG